MKDLLNQKVVLYLGIALLVIGIAGLTRGETSTDTPAAEEQTSSEVVATTITSNADGTVVSYQAVAGQSALDSLKSGAQVETEESTFGEYVTAINGVSQTSTEYWIFYIDGEAATVGAADYIAQGGEQIEWRLEQ